MIRQLLRSVGAALALVALTIGVPVLLVVFGRSPLDGTGSAWDQIADLPGQAVTDHMVFGLLTIAAWIAWALFSLQVVAELAAALGQSARWRLPAMGPMQMAARRLVVALTMSATLTSQRTAAVPTLASAAVAAPAADVGHAPDLGLVSPFTPTSNQTDVSAPPTAIDIDPQQSPPLTAAPVPAQEQAEAVVTVAPGDSPWMLAERHLGDGLRWREIWDLNRGQPQPDGQAWIVEDLIRPGWQLRLPVEAVNVPTPAEPSPDADQAPPAPPPPDDEEAAFPGAPQPDDSIATPAPPDAPEAPETSATSSPAPAPTAPPPPEPTTTQQTVITPAPSHQPATGDEEHQDDDDDDSSRPYLPLLGGGSLVLAVAALRELHRRQARRRTRLPSSVVPPIGPRLQLHRELLLRAEEEHKVDRLDAALAHLTRSLRDRTGPATAQPRVVQVADHRIDILLDRTDPAPPAPWRAEAAGLIWVLDANAEVPASADDVSPLPALVTIGVGDADIMINLEAYGVVALVGDEDACQSLARSMATELATRSDSAAVEIVGGIGGHSLDRLDAVRRCQRWDEADTRAMTASARLLDSGGWPHTWSARTSGRIYDGWTPTIWLTAHSNDHQYLDVLETIRRRPGAGTALVVVGNDPGCGLRVQLDGRGGFEIPELNLYGATQRIDTQATDELADLLDAAEAEPEPEPAWTSPPDAGMHPTHAGIAAAPALPGAGGALDWLETAEYADPPYDVLVRVCGPIRADGGRSPLPHRETAVAAYIALNGEVDIEQIRDAVWAGVDVSLKRVRNVISTVRHSVGEAITFTADHRLTPGPGLITDLELIRRRLTHAQTRQDGTDKTDILRGALDLVTGRVCTYPHSRRRCWTWIDLDNWIPHVESIVASVASQLARLYLDRGDGQGACWAAQRGIDTTGQRDELTILLVRGYERLGDEAAARQVIRSYERYLEELGVDELNDDLLELLDRYAAPARHKATR